MRVQRGPSLMPLRAGRGTGLRGAAVGRGHGARTTGWRVQCTCGLRLTQRGLQWSGARFEAACSVLSVREAITDLRYHIDLPRC